MAKAGSRAWDVVVMVLLVGSVGVVFWHASTDDAQLRRSLEWVDLALCAFFVAEWGWRVLTDKRRGHYAATRSWELLGMLPILTPVPAALRVLRLVRLVRILRVFGALGRRLGTWERIAKEGSILTIAAASGALTLVGAVVVWLLERDQPGAVILRFQDALWWAAVTITTVGYGDYYPVTSGGRFVAVLLMVAGIGTIGLLASNLASVLVVRKEAEEGVTAPPVMTGKLVHDLQTLAALHDAGKLDKGEYEKAKAHLLR